MAVVKVVSSAKDAGLARRIAEDLQAKGHQVVDHLPAGYGPILVAVLSPQTGQTSSNSAPDPAVNAAIIDALDNGQHIIPVLAATMPLPKLIDNLMFVDFSGGYPLEALHLRIEQLAAPDAPRPLKTLTPAVRRANLRAGLVVVAVVLFVFASALYAVGALGLKMPQEEYDEIETQRVEQRNTLIGPTLDAFLPRSTQEAIDFPGTVEALPTRLRPFIAATATARSE